MNPRLFLKVMLMLVPAVICLFLPDTLAHEYTRVMYPAILVIGAALSLRVAFIYTNWLRKAFIFLALFLFLMVFTHIEELWGIYRTSPQLVVLLQWITYAMLVLCSYYVLKVTEARQASKTRKSQKLHDSGFFCK